MGAPQYEQAGADIGGSGTTNTIPRWTGASTLGDSGLIDNGTTITSSRRFGVGAAAPSGVQSYSSAADGTYQLALAGTTKGLRFLTSASVAQIDAVDNTLVASYQPLFMNGSTVTLAYGGAAALTVNASGNVGIGTASPLSIAGVGLTVYGATNGAFYLQNSSNNSRVVSNGNDVYIDAGAGGTGGAVVFRRSSSVTESARIDSSGNIILNSATTNAVIQASGTGQGLKLQGTGGTNNTDPNTLDFYADGGTANSGGVAWTPTLKFGGNTTGITYNTQMGRYTRIGNMVFASCYIRLTSKGTATGAATIDGLPTCVNLAGFYAAGAIGYTAAITSTGTMQINMLANQTQLTIRQVTAVGVNTAVTDTDFANGSEIIVSISYPVN